LLAGGGFGGHFEVLRSTDSVAHVSSQAIGGHNAEADTGNDRNVGRTGPLVEVVEGTKYLQLVTDVEVVCPCVEAGLGHWGGGMQKRARCVEDQVNVAQSLVQRSGIVESQHTVRQLQLVGQGSHGGGAPASENGPVTVFDCVLGD
jgi:hypothetical protein